MILSNAISFNPIPLYKNGIFSWDIIYVKGYGFLSFENIGKNVSIKYRRKLLDSAKKSTTDLIKTPSKRAIKKKQQKQLVI